jgi:hypothetical protein
MADSPQTLAGILNALGQNVRADVIRAINRRSVMLRMLRIVPGTGKNTAWDLELGGAVAENHADGADAANFGSDALVQAVLPWGLARANFRVTDTALAAARANRNPAGLVGLLRRNLTNGATALSSLINGQLYTGSGSGGQIVGLATALRDDNTYGGIDRTDSANALFRATVRDAAGDPLTLAMARNMISTRIYNASGEQPDFAFCSSETFEYLGGLFTEQRRYNDTVRTVQTPRGPIVLDASIGTIEIEGCVFIKDKDCNADIHFINSDAVELEVLPLMGGEDVPESSVTEQADDGHGPIPLGYKVVELGRMGASRRFSMMSNLALKVLRPNACGRLTNFTMP